MSRISMLWQGLKNHGDRHAREVAKPVLAGIAAGNVVQDNYTQVEFIIQMTVFFIMLIIFYEIFEQFYGRPESQIEEESKDSSEYRPAS